MSEPPRPSVSTDDIGPFFSVSAKRKGKVITVIWGPDDITSLTRRITGVRRILAAQYLVKKDGNKCALRFPEFCIMGDRPFKNPEKADFDHIKIMDPPDHRLKNLRLTCGPCNRHALSVQWKSILTMGSAGLERERTPRTGLLSETQKERADASIRISMDIYPVYVRWLNDEIALMNRMSVREAVARGAKFMRDQTGHGSPQSARNYLDMLTIGKDAPYEVVEAMVQKRDVMEKRLTPMEKQA